MPSLPSSCQRIGCLPQAKWANFEEPNSPKRIRKTSCPHIPLIWIPFSPNLFFPGPLPKLAWFKIHGDRLAPGTMLRQCWWFHVWTIKTFTGIKDRNIENLKCTVNEQMIALHPGTLDLCPSKTHKQCPSNP